MPVVAAEPSSWTLESNSSSSAERLIPLRGAGATHPLRVSAGAVTHLTNTLVDYIAVVGYKVYGSLPAKACVPVQQICPAGQCLNRRSGIRNSSISAPICPSHTGPSAIQRKKFLARCPEESVGRAPGGRLQWRTSRRGCSRRCGHTSGPTLAVRSLISAVRCTSSGIRSKGPSAGRQENVSATSGVKLYSGGLATFYGASRAVRSRKLPSDLVSGRLDRLIGSY
jgi:hypothetical protein